MSIAPKRSRVVFQKLERDLIKLSSKPRAESVHRFRTGTRRLQILLGELSPKLDRSEKKLLKLLGRIRKRAGKVRDLDVQSAALRSLKIPREPRRKTQLVNHLIELRGQQEKKLRKEVDEATVREIRKRLKRAAKRFNPEASRDPLAVAQSNAATALTAPVRRSPKRCCTNTAFSASELAMRQSLPAPPRKLCSSSPRLKRIQDALGDWHDWLTLTQTAIEHLGDVRESPLVAELHNVTGAKFRHAVAVLSRTRGKLQTDSKHTARGPVPANLEPAT